MVHQDPQRLCALPGYRREGPVKFAGSSDLDDLKLHPQLLGRDFRLPQLAFLEDGMRRIPEGSHPGAAMDEVDDPSKRLVHLVVAFVSACDLAFQGRTISLLNRVPRRTKRLAAS